MPPPLIGINCHYPTEKDEAAVLATYYQAVVKAGGAPVLLPPLLRNGYVPAIFSSLQGILLIGGKDIDPRRFGQKCHRRTEILPRQREVFDFSLIRTAYTHNVPLLGICLGMQEINVAFGGDIIQDLKGTMHRAATNPRTVLHSTNIVKKTQLQQILQLKKMIVSSAHHQAVGLIGKGLVPSAYARDGVVECIEKSDRSFLMGVQWHPERKIGNQRAGQKLLRAFVNAAKRYKKG